jgi:hypothetical protein
MHVSHETRRARAGEIRLWGDPEIRLRHQVAKKYTHHTHTQARKRTHTCPAHKHTRLHAYRRVDTCTRPHGDGADKAMLPLGVPACLTVCASVCGGRRSRATSARGIGRSLAARQKHAEESGSEADTLALVLAKTELEAANAQATKSTTIMSERKCASETQEHEATRRGALAVTRRPRQRRARIASTPPPRASHAPRLLRRLFLLLALLLAVATRGGAAGSVRDPWRELGLRRGHATPQQVRASYLRLARELHPDKNRQDALVAAVREERFKRVLSAYEDIMRAPPGSPGAAGPDGACGGPTAPSGASTARRAGSMPARPSRSAPRQDAHAAPPAKGSGGGTAGVGLYGSASNADVRVFTDTVRLEDMELDADEAAFTVQCRCSGRFVLPFDAAEGARGHTAINCQLCSLWIWVSCGSPSDDPTQLDTGSET